MSTEAPLEQVNFPFESKEEEDRYDRVSLVLFGSTAIVGMVAGGVAGFALANHAETSGNANDLRIATGYQHCVDFIEDQLKPGDTTITVKASSLNKKQRDDCGVVVPKYINKPEKNTDPDSGVSFLRRGVVETTVTITDAEVTLDTVDNYKAAQENRENRADHDHTGAIVATPIAAMAGLMGSVIIGANTIQPARRKRLLEKSGQKNSSAT